MDVYLELVPGLGQRKPKVRLHKFRAPSLTLTHTHTHAFADSKVDLHPGVANFSRRGVV